jgi:hypothetical protein
MRKVRFEAETHVVGSECYTVRVIVDPLLNEWSGRVVDEGLDDPLTSPTGQTLVFYRKMDVEKAIAKMRAQGIAAAGYSGGCAHCDD